MKGFGVQGSGFVRDAEKAKGTEPKALCPKRLPFALASNGRQFYPFAGFTVTNTVVP